MTTLPFTEGDNTYSFEEVFPFDTYDYYPASGIVTPSSIANGTVVDSGGEQFLDGGTSIDTVVNNGGYQLVLWTPWYYSFTESTIVEIPSGGTADDTIVNSGGEQFVDGGTASGTVISAGGEQVVINQADITAFPDNPEIPVIGSGGIAISTTVSAGGYEYVSSGGTASGTIVESGGLMEVYAGGVASDTQIYAEGSDGEAVYSGGQTYSDVAYSGGVEGVATGGISYDLTVSSGGAEVVGWWGDSDFPTLYSGGTASDTTVMSGGDISLALGGVAISATIESGGYMIMYGGATMSGTTIDAGGTLEILSGYMLSNFAVSSGVLLDVLNGGIASGTTISKSGTLVVLSGGVASGDQVYASGSAGVVVRSGGQTYDDTVFAGGVEVVLSAGSAFDLTVSDGGNVKLGLPGSAGGTVSGMTVDSGATLSVGSGGSASDTTVLGGGKVMVFAGGTTVSDTVEGDGTTNSAFEILSGGTASDATLSDTGKLIVRAGGVAYSAVVDDTTTSNGVDFGSGNNGGLMVSAGGSTSGTTIDSGGLVNISAGGQDSGTTVNDGGTLQIIAGGTDSGAQISGGEQDVYGSAISATVFAGSQVVESGGTASGSIVDGGGFLYVSSDGTASGTVLNSDGFAYVESGGKDVDAVLSGGDEYDEAGGDDLSATIDNGGIDYVSSGGVASGATINSGGIETISSGGTDSGATVIGTQNVYGSAISATVSSGGNEYVYSGGTSDLTIDPGATVTIYDGGGLTGAVVDNGTLIFDLKGSNTFNGTLTGGGSLVVEGDGTLVMGGGDGFTGSTTISGRTLELTSATAAGGGEIVFASNTQSTLRIDGKTMPTNVISGFVEGDTIDLKGVNFDFDDNSATLFETDSNTLQLVVLDDDGDEQTYDLQLDPLTDYYGGFVLGPDTDGNGDTTGTAITTTYSPTVSQPAPVVDYSTSVYPYNAVVTLTDSGGAFSGFVIGPHTILTASHPLFNSDGKGFPSITVSVNGASINVVNGVDGSFYSALPGSVWQTVKPNNPIVAPPAVVESDYAIINVNLAGLEEQLAEEGQQLGEIPLATTPFTSGAINVTGYAGTQNNDVGTAEADSEFSILQFGNSNQTFDGFSGGPVWTYDGTTLEAVGIVSNNAGPINEQGIQEPGGGQAVQLTSTDLEQIQEWENAPIPCYCPGTLIRTNRGQTRVEQLKIGDMVKIMSGGARPIKWIGRRSYGGRFVMGRKDILPVCIRAGALADTVPRRDLWVSPHHAIYLDDVLIEAKDLVNGVSIMQAERVEKVEYFHIELETHDVIIAEGAPSETFIDDDSRFMFHNAHEYRALYPDEPDAAAAPARYCAPRLDSGYEVEAVRRRIALRAGLRSAADAPRIGALRGHIDLISLRSIAGWAQNEEHPEAPVCLDICAAGQLIGQTLANRYREDLEHAGLGSGHHSFEFAPPAELSFAPHAVEVRRSLDRAKLPLSADAKVGMALMSAQKTEPRRRSG